MVCTSCCRAGHLPAGTELTFSSPLSRRPAPALVSFMETAVYQGKKLLEQISAGDESSALGDAGPIIRIGITFFQLVISFASTFSIKWPRIFNDIVQSIKFIALDFLRLPAVACIRPDIMFYQKMVRLLS